MASQSYPSSFDEPMQEEETFLDKLKFKCKQQPLVPLGCLATCVAIGLATHAIRKGNSPTAQKWFRMRVVFQGLTIVALLGGSVIYDNVAKEEKSAEDIAREKAKLRERLWIEELERRDYEAKERQRRAELARKYKLSEESEK
ncbi:unnamed protein product [Kuraishia capsulata CBS 1993]|uniref:Respiratory supercomplex factor 1, mitochondrial n=1 Tax=Kuraishia capsulata CBS 1993 TaxID=1382522 RepID=W6MSW8_9ASCO|nr:uncharacterized protein KUCA_T00000832001 [Kuraishia capsulata CBS 1993]CDK24865.1 unnamed protein product [Kuraishia capsulata CBS 1993]